ncbi:MAG: hypothetical protein OXT71_21850 [Acidobacteriota bacterium]|nr:hypothetical protein [Acidobacteriota bacterium]
MSRYPSGLRWVTFVMLLGLALGCRPPSRVDRRAPDSDRPGARLILYSGFDSLGKSEGWHSYDYDGGIESGPDLFHPVSWEPRGGAFGSGYIWTDDSRWRIDTPEQPNSILALIFYRRWVGGPKLDLRGARISVNLRGDDLDLKGAQCYFWAHIRNNRWHFTDQPIPISQGSWGRRHTFVLENDETKWTRTWAWTGPASLDRVLRECVSYGFSFIGFPEGEEVTGRLSMDVLRIEARVADMR